MMKSKSMSNFYREFNEMMHQAINSQMTALNENCERSNAPKKLEALPIIKTLYLIHFHGLDK